MDETTSLEASKIFESLSEVIAANNVTEYEILPGFDQHQKQKPFVLHKQSLGLYKWCIKPLFTYAYDKLRLGQQIAAGKHSDAKFVTCVLLMIQPDHMTSWNVRKRLIQDTVYSCEEELTFINLILQKHPKSGEAFIHRRWLLQRMLPERRSPLDTMTLAGRECEICQLAADRYASNYYAWSHRLWVVDTFNLMDSKIFLDEEFERAEKFVQTHISDHSGFHYKLALLQMRLKLTDTLKFSSLFESEMNNVEDLLLFYQDHESLYAYYRGLVCLPHNMTVRNTSDNSSVLMPSDYTVRAREFISKLHSRHRSDWDTKLCERFLNSFRVFLTRS